MFTSPVQPPRLRPVQRDHVKAIASRLTDNMTSLDDRAVDIKSAAGYPAGLGSARSSAPSPFAFAPSLTDHGESDHGLPNRRPTPATPASPLRDPCSRPPHSPQAAPALHLSRQGRCLPEDVSRASIPPSASVSSPSPTSRSSFSAEGSHAAAESVAESVFRTLPSRGASPSAPPSMRSVERRYVQIVMRDAAVGSPLRTHDACVTANACVGTDDSPQTSSGHTCGAAEHPVHPLVVAPPTGTKLDVACGGNPSREADNHTPSPAALPQWVFHRASNSLIDAATSPVCVDNVVVESTLRGAPSKPPLWGGDSTVVCPPVPHEELSTAIVGLGTGHGEVLDNDTVVTPTLGISGAAFALEEALAAAAKQIECGKVDVGRCAARPGDEGSPVQSPEGSQSRLISQSNRVDGAGMSSAGVSEKATSALSPHAAAALARMRSRPGAYHVTVTEDGKLMVQNMEGRPLPQRNVVVGGIDLSDAELSPSTGLRQSLNTDGLRWSGANDDDDEGATLITPPREPLPDTGLSTARERVPQLSGEGTTLATVERSPVQMPTAVAPATTQCPHCSGRGAPLSTPCHRSPTAVDCSCTAEAATPTCVEPSLGDVLSAGKRTPYPRPVTDSSAVASHPHRPMGFFTSSPKSPANSSTRTFTLRSPHKDFRIEATPAACALVVSPSRPTPPRHLDVRSNGYTSRVATLQSAEPDAVEGSHQRPSVPSRSRPHESGARTATPSGAAVPRSTWGTSQPLSRELLQKASASSAGASTPSDSSSSSTSSSSGTSGGSSSGSGNGSSSDDESPARVQVAQLPKGRHSRPQPPRGGLTQRDARGHPTPSPSRGPVENLGQRLSVTAEHVRTSQAAAGAAPARAQRSASSPSRPVLHSERIPPQPRRQKGPSRAPHPPPLQSRPRSNTHAGVSLTGAERYEAEGLRSPAEVHDVVRDEEPNYTRSRRSASHHRVERYAIEMHEDGRATLTPSRPLWTTRDAQPATPSPPAYDSRTHAPHVQLRRSVSASPQSLPQKRYAFRTSSSPPRISRPAGPPAVHHEPSQSLARQQQPATQRQPSHHRVEASWADSPLRHSSGPVNRSSSRPAASPMSPQSSRAALPRQSRVEPTAVDPPSDAGMALWMERMEKLLATAVAGAAAQHQQQQMNRVQEQIEQLHQLQQLTTAPPKHDAPPQHQSGADGSALPHVPSSAPISRASSRRESVSPRSDRSVSTVSDDRSRYSYGHRRSRSRARSSARSHSRRKGNRTSDVSCDSQRDGVLRGPDGARHSTPLRSRSATRSRHPPPPMGLPAGPQLPPAPPAVHCVSGAGVPILTNPITPASCSAGCGGGEAQQSSCVVKSLVPVGGGQPLSTTHQHTTTHTAPSCCQFRHSAHGSPGPSPSARMPFPSSTGGGTEGTDARLGATLAAHNYSEAHSHFTPSQAGGGGCMLCESHSSVPQAAPGHAGAGAYAGGGGGRGAHVRGRDPPMSQYVTVFDEDRHGEIHYRFEPPDVYPSPLSPSQPLRTQGSQHHPPHSPLSAQPPPPVPSIGGGRDVVSDRHGNVLMSGETATNPFRKPAAAMYSTHYSGGSMSSRNFDATGGDSWRGDGVRAHVSSHVPGPELLTEHMDIQLHDAPAGTPPRVKAAMPPPDLGASNPPNKCMHKGCITGLPAGGTGLCQGHACPTCGGDKPFSARECTSCAPHASPPIRFGLDASGRLVPLKYLSKQSSGAQDEGGVDGGVERGATHHAPQGTPSTAAPTQPPYVPHYGAQSAHGAHTSPSGVGALSQAAPHSYPYGSAVAAPHAEYAAVADAHPAQSPPTPERLHEAKCAHKGCITKLAVGPSGRCSGHTCPTCQGDKPFKATQCGGCAPDAPPPVRYAMGADGVPYKIGSEAHAHAAVTHTHPGPPTAASAQAPRARFDENLVRPFDGGVSPPRHVPAPPAPFHPESRKRDSVKKFFNR